MRRPNRNIEIFSMSVLDLFAACLGAFILISVILFPNYQKQQQAEQKLETSEATLKQCKSDRAVVEKTIASCEAALASTFIVVSIEWSAYGDFDIDLHVYDPKGNEFYWARNNRGRTDYPETDAQLSYDNTRGPGVELWQLPKAEPGIYRIAYNYLGRLSVGNSVEVKGNIFYRNGRVELPAVTLTEAGTKRTIAHVTVSQSATIDVRIEP